MKTCILTVAVAACMSFTSTASSSFLTDNDNTSDKSRTSDIIAKRKAAMVNRNDRDDNCTERKAAAYAKEAALKKQGVPEDNPEWRKVKRMISIVNTQCPAPRNTKNVVASVCRSRETALLNKLDSLKAAGVPKTNEEVVTTEVELAETRRECAGKTIK